MPEVKCYDIVRLSGFVKEFGEKYFTTDGIILFSKLYEVKVTAEKRFTEEQHCNIAKQKSCVNREFAAESRQQLLSEKTYSSLSILGSAYQFSKDLCKIKVLSNIPLHKVVAARFRKFLEKYTTHPIPTESTLRKKNLASCYAFTINKIRNSIGKKQNMVLHS
jgi:hypothetical protein